MIAAIALGLIVVALILATLDQLRGAVILVCVAAILLLTPSVIRVLA